MKEYCKEHTHKLKKTDCCICRKPICDDCMNIISGRVYCKSCGYGVVAEAEEMYIKKAYKTIVEKGDMDVIRDKRKYERINIVKVVEIFDEDKNNKVNGIMINMSPGDMAVITDESFSIGDRVKLEFVLKEELKFKNIQGGIIRVNKIGEKYNVGISFMNLGDNKEKLEDFVLGKLHKKFIREDISYV